jgi:hypothetical protein
MMKVQRKLFLCLVALVFVAGLDADAMASCPRVIQGPPCFECWRPNTVIFIGVATQVVLTPNNTGLMIGPYVRSTVHFTIEEAFKGIEGSAIDLELDYCGYLFKEGERYLVYAHRNPNDNKLNVRDGSTRTRLLSQAGEDLEYLRELSSAEPGSRVYGKVAQSTHNIKDSRYEAEPLTEVKVVLEGGNERRVAVSDSEGNYQFTGLPAGTYRLRAELPARLSFPEQTIRVTGRGCVPMDITTNRNGQIAGRVLDMNGNPLAYVPVSLVSADASLEQILSEGKDKGAWTFTLTNEQGRYWFTNLAPGRYLLVINRAEFEKSRGTEISRLLPRLFYPGVIDITQASVVVVRDEQKPREYDFRLPH